jgi:hypothetical protein
MEEYDGIIDDDPALDVIMIEEMEKENKKGSDGQNNGGCLSVIAILILPVSIVSIKLFM